MSEKKKAKLNNWSKCPFSESLIGNVEGHYNSELSDGEKVRTSRIVKLDEENNTAETLNTIYTLGKKAE
jgi:hypothetical protein